MAGSGSSRLLALALVLAPALALAASAPLLDMHGLSTPLLIWSSLGNVGRQSGGPHVSYQVLPDAASLAGDVVLGALGKPLSLETSMLDQLLDVERLAKDQHSALVVYVGNQLDLATLQGSSAPSQLLTSLMNAAAASLALPYTSTSGLLPTLQAKLSNEDVPFQVLGCGAAAASSNLEGEVRAALAHAAEGRPQVLIVCAPDASEAEGSGVEAEVARLVAVQADVEAASPSYLFVYAVDAPAGAATSRRILQATTANYTGFGPYQNCGTLCQTQVQWLQGMLVVLFLALASCSGLLCLYLLDTPTRFDAPKEGAAAS